MTEKNMEIDEEAKHHVCIAYIKCNEREPGRLFAAFDLVDEAMQSGEHVMEDTFTALARGLALQGYWEQVDDVLGWMEYRLGEIPDHLRLRIDMLRSQVLERDEAIARQLGRQGDI
jgi:hypothetical protein